jgi:hypothetical protein
VQVVSTSVWFVEERGTLEALSQQQADASTSQGLVRADTALSLPALLFVSTINRVTFQRSRVLKCFSTHSLEATRKEMYICTLSICFILHTSYIVIIIKSILFSGLAHYDLKNHSSAA